MKIWPRPVVGPGGTPCIYAEYAMSWRAVRAPHTDNGITEIGRALGLGLGLLHSPFLCPFLVLQVTEKNCVKRFVVYDCGGWERAKGRTMDACLDFMRKDWMIKRVNLFLRGLHFTFLGHLFSNSMTMCGAKLFAVLSLGLGS